MYRHYLLPGHSFRPVDDDVRKLEHHVELHQDVDGLNNLEDQLLVRNAVLVVTRHEHYLR